MTLTIRTAHWDTDRDLLKTIRQEVFVKEQSVPEELEWDNEDDLASHWLAFDGEEPVGTVRMLLDGHIGRMAVIKSHRGRSIGAELMKTIIEECQRRQLLECYLYAQTHALTFYEQLGFSVIGEEFMDAGIPHKKMICPIAQQRQLGLHGGKFAVHNLAGTVLDLVSQCDRTLSILSFDLQPDIYNQPALADAISKLARRSRYTDIRLLVVDTKALVQRKHSLLELSRRLSSSIEIRRTEADLRNLPEAFVVADSRGVIVYDLKNEDDNNAWANYNNKPMAEARLAEFDLLWSRAVQDRELKVLGIS